MSEKRIKVSCPCCHSELTVDRETGLVIKHSRQRSAASFDEALEREQQRRGKADELFAKAFENERKRTSDLEKKFREAFDSQDELEDPVRPFDLD
ncbi:MAG TPA: hypothetical protein VLU25_09090 [Acidobacteriota bacterium]|nr:hypothetical protein [Acidobacteriota bacterium]